MKPNQKPADPNQRLSEQLLKAIKSGNYKTFSKILTSKKDFNLNIYESGKNIFLAAAEKRNDSMYYSLVAAGALYFPYETKLAPISPPYSLLDYYKQIKTTVESMSTKVTSLTKSNHFSSLKQIATGALKIQYDFLITLKKSYIPFKVIQDLYTRFNSLSGQFNELYARALQEQPLTSSEVTYLDDSAANNLRFFFADKLKELDEISKAMQRKSTSPLYTKSTINHLQTLCDNFLKIIKKLQKLYKMIYNKSANIKITKLKSELKKNYKRALKISIEFETISEKDTQPIATEKKPDLQYHLFNVCNQSIDRLSTIAITISNLEKTIQSSQESWLATQERIKSFLGLSSLCHLIKLPGSDEMAQLTLETQNLFKNLTEILEYKIHAQNREHDSIFEQCRTYVSKNQNNPTKLATLANILKSTTAPLYIIQFKYEKLILEVAKNCSLTLITQKNIERDLTYPDSSNASCKRSKSKSIKTSEHASTQTSITSKEEVKKNITGLQTQSLKTIEEFSFTIPGNTTPSLSYTSNNSFFSTSFEILTHKPFVRPIEFKLSDFVTTKLLKNKISEILATPIIVDFTKDEKYTITDLQEMSLKTNALLMIFCQFYETINQNAFQLSFPIHFTYMHLIKNFRNCIYYHFPNLFSCTWPKKVNDFVEAKTTIAEYKQVFGLITALVKSIKYNNFSLLNDNPFFAKYSSSKIDLTTTREMLDKSYRYFKTIKNQSLPLKRETMELAQKFSTGAMDLLARELQLRRNQPKVDSSFRHEAMTFS